MHDVHIEALDLNLLVALRALLAERHVTRAAARVGLTQPAMSHALGRLREVLGDPLLVRTPSGMVPTPRAEAMREPLERALADLGRALAAPEPFDPARAKRRFRFATSDYVELVLFPRLCARLWAEAPGVDVRLRPIGGTGVAELAEDRTDIVIGPADSFGTAPGVRIQKLFEDRFVCVVREDHPVAKKKRLDLDTFVALPHALITPRGQNARGAVDDALARLGLERRVALEIPHFLVAPHVVRETDVILTLAERVARMLAPVLGLVRLAPPLEVQGFAMSMAWHDRHHADPAHAWLRRVTADAAKTI